MCGETNYKPRVAKRVAVFEDISGVGRCALSVAIPVLAALGVQPCALPTAVLSAHTAYPDVCALDLTDFLASAIRHWEAEDFAFDAALSGYISDIRQAEIIGAFMKRQRERHGALIVVDPAMADNGKLYRGMSEKTVLAMRDLCSGADVILPNRTEAHLLTGTSYGDAPLSLDALSDMLDRLLALGAKSALIKGVRVNGGMMGNALKRTGENGVHFTHYDPLNIQCPGTGDLFAAALTGAHLAGDSLPYAMARATDFTFRAIARTLVSGREPREGVQFEPLLSGIDGIRGMDTVFLRENSAPE